MEEARVDFLARYGWDYAKLEEMGIISPVLSVSCDFRHPTTFSDRVILMIWGGFSVDIWTEQLERRHLPLLAHWFGRTSGAMTPNDLPTNTEELSQWYEISSADSGRQDFLILVYDTPVGLAGLRQRDDRGEVLELYLQLYEVNYNPLRTATYATLHMLDRAFLDNKAKRVEARVSSRQRDYLEALERLGFSQTAADNEIICVAVEKDPYLSRKYLF